MRSHIRRMGPHIDQHRHFPQEFHRLPKGVQIAAFYDQDANGVPAKRRLGTKRWEFRKTRYRGNVNNAQNSISIMIDGDGFLHMAWDLHGSPLRYCRLFSRGNRKD